jgi:hypothetical protein
LAIKISIPYREEYEKVMKADQKAFENYSFL